MGGRTILARAAVRRGVLAVVAAAGALAAAPAAPAPASAPPPADGSAGARASSHRQPPIAYTRRFRDPHGHVLTLHATSPTIDVAPVAALLAQRTYHHREIERVETFVTDDAGVQGFCEGTRTRGCYESHDPHGPTGIIVVSHRDPSLRHTVLHEYGHHVDQTLNNFNEDDCPTLEDASRRWMVERGYIPHLFNVRTLTCVRSRWWRDHGPEVFAEDYAQLAGLPSWFYTRYGGASRPTREQLAALKRDLDRPFRARTVVLRGSALNPVHLHSIYVPEPSYIRFGEGGLAFQGRINVRSVSFACASTIMRVFRLGRCRVYVRPARIGRRYAVHLRLS